jgi:hypothetical protein
VLFKELSDKYVKNLILIPNIILTTLPTLTVKRIKKETFPLIVLLGTENKGTELGLISAFLALCIS